jgi:hypothetical protein
MSRMALWPMSAGSAAARQAFDATEWSREVELRYRRPTQRCPYGTATQAWKVPRSMPKASCQTASQH